jgi:hypothetical protein
MNRILVLIRLNNSWRITGIFVFVVLVLLSLFRGISYRSVIFFVDIYTFLRKINSCCRSCMYLYNTGRAVARTVSRRLPTAAARVRAQVRLCGICDGRSGAGASFLWVLRFPLPILIPPNSSYSSSSIFWGWYSRPKCVRRTKWPQSHPTPRI